MLPFPGLLLALISTTTEMNMKSEKSENAAALGIMTAWGTPSFLFPSLRPRLSLPVCVSALCLSAPSVGVRLPVYTFACMSICLSVSAFFLGGQSKI